MAWHLFGAKPLFALVLTDCQLHFSLIKIHWKTSAKCQPCYLGPDRLTQYCCVSVLWFGCWCPGGEWTSHFQVPYTGKIIGTSCRTRLGNHWLNRMEAVIFTASFNPWRARELSYLGLTRSISWLLMPWLLTSPGHQQPWYWLYRICRSLS